MENKVSCKLISIGFMKLRLNDGSIKIFFKVRHVLELKRSLISLGTLEKEGYCFQDEDSVLKILKS